MGAWAKGSTSRWRRIRARVLAENKRTNDGRCTLQLRECTGEADTVHHVVGRALTGDDPRYLVAACAWCNGSVGDPARRRGPEPKRVSTW